MRNNTIALLTALTLPVFCGEPVIKIDSDRADAQYKEGDIVEFRFTALRDGGSIPIQELDVVIWNENNLLSIPEIHSGKETKIIQVPAVKPGFIQAGVRLNGSRKEYIRAGVAVSPEKIRAVHRVPDDFDAFWEKRMNVVKKGKFSVRMKNIRPELLKDCEGLVCRDVSITSESGLTATGYLMYPENAKAHTLPIFANFLGASKVTAEVPITRNAAKEGTLAFCLNYHGLSNQLTREEIRKRRGNLKNYQYKNADNPDLYYMNGIFMRVILALEYLKSLPQWDGKKLIVRGGSLGGCQAIVAAALEPKVTLCVSGATAMCGHFNNPPGWPLLLHVTPEAKSFASYFDTASFTSRVHCETVMAIGYIDRTVPPASTLSAFYNLPISTSKKIFHVLKGDHNGNSPDHKGVYYYGIDEIRRHIKE